MTHNFRSLALLLGLFGCGSGPSTAEARGRNAYLANCIACHNPNPSLPGPLGPPVKGSSRELLEARMIRGEYPAGYRPKRDTRQMPAQPHLASHINDLAAFLK